MKLKDILSVMLVVALGGTSCTSEMPIDNKGTDSENALSVVLSVSDVATKAIDGPAGEYAIATEKEIKINSFHVAIFDGATHKRIDYKNITDIASAQSTTVAVDNKNYQGYKTTFDKVSTRDHASVYALVIANTPDNYTTFASHTDLSDYERDIANNVVVTPSFAADNLAKAGKSSVTALTGHTSVSLLVPLTQLSARIDFGTASVKTKAGGGFETVETFKDSVSMMGVVTGADGFAGWETLRNRAETKANDRNDGSWSPKLDQKEGPLNDFDDDYSHRNRRHYNNWEAIQNLNGGYYYSPNFTQWTTVWAGITRERHRNATYQNRILLVRKKITTKKITTTTHTTETPEIPSGFKVTSVTYSGVNGNSRAVFESGSNTQYKGIGGTISENTSFYTYEFPSIADQSQLELEIKGSFQGGAPGSSSTETTVTEETIAEKWVYGIWEQNRGNGWGSVSTAVTENTTGITWYDDDLTADIPLSKSAISTDNSSLKSDSKAYTYNMKWSDIKDQQGNPVTLQRGYRYQLSVRLEQYELKVVVTKEAWTIKEIGVDYGQ